MKSIKPGRGPSAMGAAGSVISIIFGIFWTIIAASITKNSPFPLIGIVFPLFGILFIGMGVVNFVYHYKNATSRHRMSLLDITDHDEEPDPLNVRFGAQYDKNAAERHAADSGTDQRPVRRYPGDYCPFCGVKVEQTFDFCPKCGKDI